MFRPAVRQVQVGLLGTGQIPLPQQLPRPGPRFVERFRLQIAGFRLGLRRDGLRMRCRGFRHRRRLGRDFRRFLLGRNRGGFYRVFHLRLVDDVPKRRQLIGLEQRLRLQVREPGDIRAHPPPEEQQRDHDDDDRQVAGKAGIPANLHGVSRRISGVRRMRSKG